VEDAHEEVVDFFRKRFSRFSLSFVQTFLLGQIVLMLLYLKVYRKGSDHRRSAGFEPAQIVAPRDPPEAFAKQAHLVFESSF